MIPRMGNSYPRLGFEMASPDGGRFGLPRFPEGSGNSRANHATLLSELIKSDVRPNDGQKDGRGSTAGEVQNMGSSLPRLFFEIGPPRMAAGRPWFSEV